MENNIKILKIMSNSELSPKATSEIEAILANNPLETPSQAKYRRCNMYIQQSIQSLLRIPEFWSKLPVSFFSEKPNRVLFSIGLDNYAVEYYKRIGNDTEENLVLSINTEKIRLHTYKNIDGRVNSSILYFVDSPEFVVEKYLDPEENEKEAIRMLGKLEEATSN